MGNKLLKYSVLLMLVCLCVGVTGAQGRSKHAKKGDTQNFTVPLDKLSSGDAELEMIYVEAGTFTHGSPDDEKGRKELSEARFKVKITEPFWIGRYEITQAQWQNVMGKEIEYYATKDKQLKPIKGNNVPMTCITWDEALDFCNTLTAREREANRLQEGYRYSLPYDVQWEFAAKGGNRSKGYLFSGSNTIAAVARHKIPIGAVGNREPNELGIQDMTGNVAEMTLDKVFGPSGAKLQPPGEVNEDPAGIADGTNINSRGGSASSSPENSRVSASSNVADRRTRQASLGFRIVLCKAWPGDPEVRPKVSDNDEKLLTACEAGDGKAIESALTAGADVNIQDGSGAGNTPLLLLCKRKKEEEKLVIALISKGADVNKTSIDGYTPLHYAAENKHEKLVELLLKKGADANAATDAGLTPLHLAAQADHAGIVKILLKNGADINIETKKKVLAYTMAKRPELKRLLKPKQ